MSARANQDSALLGRRLMRSCERAALATSLLGAPYASLVLIAADLDASPLLLLSDLAQHSRNIAADPRVSLLLDGTEGHVERLDGPRLSVLGQAKAVSDPDLLARFIARHPSSAAYAGFADFRLYRIAVERGHLVAGFGRIEWIERERLLFAGNTAALAAAEPALLDRLNETGEMPIDRLAQRALGVEGEGWRIVGIDPDGIDLCRAGAVARLDFPQPAATPEAVLAELRLCAQNPNNNWLLTYRL
jgi:heme iron utilization protein